MSIIKDASAIIFIAMYIFSIVKGAITLACWSWPDWGAFAISEKREVRS